MAAGIATIIEMRLEAEGSSARIALPQNMSPTPGQYLLASLPNALEPLPAAIFPSRIDRGEILAPPPLPASWTVGTQLSIRGPLGSGFQVPLSARRLAIASLDGPPSRLLPLVAPALETHAAVAVYARSTPYGLPEEVEVLPSDLLHEALAWADFLAVEAPREALSGLRDRLGLKPFQRPSCAVQVLVTGAMPCGGMAECGVCAVLTTGGWRLACSDGPVFDFNLFEG
jgi:dihydroorotate dehydrogenase electron transfer subunit